MSKFPPAMPTSTRRSGSNADMNGLLAGDEMRPRAWPPGGSSASSSSSASKEFHRSNRLPSLRSYCSLPSSRCRTKACGAVAGLSAIVGAIILITSRRNHHHHSHGRLDHVVRHELSYLHRSWHPRLRSERFPSVDERVRIYMSNWYVPPCRYVPRDVSGGGSKRRMRRKSTSNMYYREPTAEDRIHYRYEYPDLETWSQRPNFQPNMTINFVAEVSLDGPMHYASGDACHDIVLSTDVETSTPKDYEKHNLYVLDRDLVAKCADTPPRQNHHAPYCRDALEMLDIVDALDGDRTQHIDDDGGKVRSGDLTLYARTGLQMRKQIAYGYDPRDQDLKLVVEAMLDKRTGGFVDIRNTRTPVIVRFGDTLGVLCDLPIIGKTRIAAEAVSRKNAIASASIDPFLNVEARSTTPPTGAAAADVTEPHSDACHPLHLHVPRLPLQTVDWTFEDYSPIVWDFHSSRSNEPLEEVLRDDIPWKKKKDVAFWRGALTGAREKFDRKVMSDEEVCDRIPRCRLVMLHDKSKLVDARLTRVVDVPMDDLPNAKLFTKGNKKMTYKEQLQYKALIVMEGNDLATGLRWSLLSRSVVMMPPPERTSWAMEEWLEPWTHYIPLHRNLTNVEEMVQWMRDNDKEARQIAERGALCAHDLVLHPNTKKDDDDVKREILRRYRQYFVPDRQYDQ